MFFLRPLAKDQGITWVVFLVPVVLHHLVHFLLKRNLSEKNLAGWESNRGPSDLQPSTYPMSYRAINVVNVKIDFYISPQTLDQNWLTLVYSQPATKKLPKEAMLNISVTVTLLTTGSTWPLPATSGPGFWDLD